MQEELLAMEQRINELVLEKQDSIERIDEQIKEQEALKAQLKSKVDFAVQVSRAYEEKIQEKAMFDSEAFGTLCVKIQAQCGGALDDDCRQFTEAAEIEQPETIKQETAEEEQTEAVA
jgi:hypothetical protein